MSHLLGLPRDWIPTLEQFLQHEPVVARVVVTEARGSTPREAGAFMLVGHDAVEGSIGGGRLEWEAIAAARELLTAVSTPARTNKIVLAADVGQCCGGVVSIWLERFTRDELPTLHAASEAGARGPAVLVSEVTSGGSRRCVVSVVHPRSTTMAAAMSTAISDATRDAVDHVIHTPRPIAHPIVLTNTAGDLTFIERLDDPLPSVWLYGAGHVGQALARILTELPLRLTWIDSRAELFPTPLPPGVRIVNDPDTLATVSEAPVGAYVIVMSHSHPLDYELCHALLERNDFAWAGLIGSDSKAARFRSRLARSGLGKDVINRLVCPIGVEGINSKWPAAIAVAVAAQLMQKISAATARSEVLASADSPRDFTRIPQLATVSQGAATSRPHAPIAVPREPVSTSRGAAAAPVPPFLDTRAIPAPARASLDAPCAPERCATCGTPAETSQGANAPDRPNTPNSAPGADKPNTSRRETVSS